MEAYQYDELQQAVAALLDEGLRHGRLDEQHLGRFRESLAAALQTLQALG